MACSVAYQYRRVAGGPIPVFGVRDGLSNGSPCCRDAADGAVPAGKPSPARPSSGTPTPEEVPYHRAPGVTRAPTGGALVRLTGVSRTVTGEVGASVPWRSAPHSQAWWDFSAHNPAGTRGTPSRCRRHRAGPEGDCGRRMLAPPPSSVLFGAGPLFATPYVGGAGAAE